MSPLIALGARMTIDEGEGLKKKKEKASRDVVRGVRNVMKERTRIPTATSNYLLRRPAYELEFER